MKEIFTIIVFRGCKGVSIIGSINEMISSMFTSLKEPTKEEINENLNLLLEFPWFQEIYGVEEFRILIAENQTIRDIIGRTNVKRLQLYPRKQLQLKSKIEEVLLMEYRGT
jgi:hypothetical protein